MAVAPGQTLALIGGYVLLDGGNVTASQGHIELSSLGANSTVALVPLTEGFEFDYADGIPVQDIQLLQASSLDASGSGGGSITVRGRNLAIRDGSALINDTLGRLNGGNLTIQADALEITGIAPIAPFVSSIFSDAATTATAPGGSINLTVQDLTVAEGGQIGVNTLLPRIAFSFQRGPKLRPVPWALAMRAMCRLTLVRR